MWPVSPGDESVFSPKPWQGRKKAKEQMAFVRTMLFARKDWAELAVATVGKSRGREEDRREPAVKQAQK